MNSLINNGIHLLNYDKAESKKQDNKTIIICGVPRSGTSMVAKIIQSFGINLGDHTSSGTIEDKDVYQLLEGNSTNLSKFRELVEIKNKQNKMWGWKRPMCFTYIHKFENEIINPHFIIPFKDILSIGIRNNVSLNKDILKSIEIAFGVQQKLINFLNSTNHPCFLFSYEKALSEKEYFVKSLIDFIQIPTNANNSKLVDNAIKQIKKVDNEYLSESNRIKKGFVDLVSKTKITGWAVSDTQNFELLFKINGAVQKRITPSIFRKRAFLKGIHPTGKCGFEIDLNQLNIKLKSKDKIEIVFSDTLKHLINSPSVVE